MSIPRVYPPSNFPSRSGKRYINFKLNPPPFSSSSRPANIPLKSILCRPGASPRIGAFGVCRLLFSIPALEGKVGNMAVLFILGSSLKYGESSTSCADGRPPGFRLSRLDNKLLPAVVRNGNLLLITEPCVAGFFGKRKLRAFGRRRKPGHDSSVGIPQSSKIFESSSTSFFPWSSGSRVSSSPNMHPTDHMSTSVPYLSAPSNSSGARYQRVTTSWVSFGLGSPKYRAIPKSAILRMPRLLRRRLEVLRSRWRIQFE